MFDGAFCVGFNDWMCKRISKRKHLIFFIVFEKSSTRRQKMSYHRHSELVGPLVILSLSKGGVSGEGH